MSAGQTNGHRLGGIGHGLTPFDFFEPAVAVAADGVEAGRRPEWSRRRSTWRDCPDRARVSDRPGRWTRASGFQWRGWHPRGSSPASRARRPGSRSCRPSGRGRPAGRWCRRRIWPGWREFSPGVGVVPGEGDGHFLRWPGQAECRRDGRTMTPRKNRNRFMIDPPD